MFPAPACVGDSRVLLVTAEFSSSPLPLQEAVSRQAAGSPGPRPLGSTQIHLG